ncbi:RNA polymerase subunit sigma-24 [Limosilactobacillus pontis]|uniref:RNA polymerase subunit sigma-24 n=1 Tax=Limosilactobacillus pontis TaxID=35787 RepID=UPI002F2695C9
MTNHTIQDGFDFLYQDNHGRLVHGVLKGLGIPVYRDDYPDLFQEGCMIFAQVYADYTLPLTTPLERRRLMSYAYRKIRWRLLDILRHQQLAVECRQYSLDQTEDPADADLVDGRAQLPFSQLTNAAFFDDLWQHASQPARRYLLLALQDRFTSDTAIAKHCGVSRQAVFQWKKQLFATARRLGRDWPDMV